MQFKTLETRFFYEGEHTYAVKVDVLMDCVQIDVFDFVLNAQYIGFYDDDMGFIGNDGLNMPDYIDANNIIELAFLRLKQGNKGDIYNG